MDLRVVDRAQRGPSSIAAPTTPLPPEASPGSAPGEHAQGSPMASRSVTAWATIWLRRIDCPCNPPRHSQTDDFCEIVVERHRKSPTIWVSDREPSEWLTMTTDALLGQSAVDRLTSGAAHPRRRAPGRARSRRPGRRRRHHPRPERQRHVREKSVRHGGQCDSGGCAPAAVLSAFGRTDRHGPPTRSTRHSSWCGPSADPRQYRRPRLGEHGQAWVLAVNEQDDGIHARSGLSELTMTILDEWRVHELIELMRWASGRGPDLSKPTFRHMCDLATVPLRARRSCHMLSSTQAHPFQAFPPGSWIKPAERHSPVTPLARWCARAAAWRLPHRSGSSRRCA